MSRSERTPQAMRAEYAGRINRVIDHIERNLDQPLGLESLARIAHFSPYYFHRIFGAMVGETLGRFVQRLRVERAATVLVSNPERPITAIALDCGFSSSATFARAFKETFGVSASRWRGGVGCERLPPDRKIRKDLGKLRKAASISGCYLDPHDHIPSWRIEMPSNEDDLNATVEVRERPELNVAYLRHTGPYGQASVVPQLVGRLREWAIPRGLMGPQSRLLLVAHDNPGVTAPDKLRLSVCLTVPSGTPVEGEVGTMTIPGGAFAVGHFEIPPARISEAWDVVIGDWLPSSGYQPDDRLCYEEVLGDPREHPEGKIALDICVPVRPL